MAGRAKKKSGSDQVRFQVLEVRKSPRGFSSYTDAEGNVHKLIVARNNGVEKKAHINFPGEQPFINIPLGKTDADGKSFVDFIKNHPGCQGSENQGDKVWFKVFDESKDAEMALQEAEMKQKAVNYALAATGEQLVHLAAYCQEFSDDVKLQRFAVHKFAEKRYREFLRVADSKDIEIIAAVKLAMEKGVIKKAGIAVKLFTTNGESIYLGKNEEAAVEKIKLDDDVRNVLFEIVKQIKQE